VTVLLDGPVLAALVIAEHEHHDRVGRWLADQPDFAVCPISEAALLRFLLRLGESPSTALAVLDSIRQHPKCRFWPADLSHAELAVDHLGAADDLNQVYLDALAAAHGGSLATLELIVG
jgi:predicted nucleic acid-binding protein